MRLRRTPPPVEVAPGERLLAWADTATGVAGGTRDALYLPEGDGWIRVPWQEVEAADWDRETEVLRVTLLGRWGEERPDHRLAVTEPGRLLELVRERVTMSVVLTRHVPLDGRRGLRVIARRAPGSDQPLAWYVEYDEGVDPGDPLVRLAADEALSAARLEVGEA